MRTLFVMCGLAIALVLAACGSDQKAQPTTTAKASTIRTSPGYIVQHPDPATPADWICWYYTNSDQHLPPPQMSVLIRRTGLDGSRPGFKLRIRAIKGYRLVLFGAYPGDGTHDRLVEVTPRYWVAWHYAPIETARVCIRPDK